MASIKEEMLAERRAIQSVGGDDPYTVPEAPNQKVLFGTVELTPDSQDKSLFRAGVEDAANFVSGFLPGIAKLVTATAGAPLIPFGDPFNSVETAKQVGLGLLETGRKLVGVTGISDVFGFQGEQKRALDYYKAHPGFALLDASIIASFGTGFVLKSSLGAVARGAVSTAIKTGVKMGVEESVIRSVLIESRGILSKTIRGAVGADTTKIAGYLENGIYTAARTGRVVDIVKLTSKALMDKGVKAETALRIAQETATSVAESVARQSSKLKVIDAVTHPVGAAFRGTKSLVGAGAEAVLGTSEKTATGRIFGVDMVKANADTALIMEKWADTILRSESGILNTVENKMKLIMDWKSSRGFEGMTKQQFFDDLANYVKADVSNAQFMKLTGRETVLTKVLPKSTTDTMIENLRGAFDDIVSEVETSFPNLTPQQRSAKVFDLVNEFMTKNSGYDFGKYESQIRAAFDGSPKLSTLEREIGKLSSSKPSIIFKGLSKEAKKIADEIEGSGWRIGIPPKGKKISQITEVAGGVTKEALKELYVGITSATERVPEIKAMGEKANALEKAGDFEGANKIHNQILDKGESVLKSLFKDMPDVKIEVQRTRGNFFGESEATFHTKLTLPASRIDEVVARLSEFANKGLKQKNLHVSEVLPNTPKGVKLGVEMADGYIYEPNIDFRFSRPLTDAELNLASKIAQEEGLAGATFHADKQGINLYNISKFKNHVQFKDEIRRLAGRLRDARDTGRLPKGAGSPVGSVRKLINIGEEGGGATRSYEDVGSAFRTKQSFSEEVISPTVKGDFQTSRTFLGKTFDMLGLSPGGILRGTKEFLFQQSFTQNALKQLGEKYGNTIRITRPIVKTTTAGVKAGKRTIAIPVESLFDWLDNHRKEFSDVAFFRRNVVYDITKDDLVKFGFAPKLADDIINVSKQSLTSIPASVVGAGEKILNYLRAANPGFQMFGDFLKLKNVNFENFIKTANYMRYESALAFAFQAQQFFETGLNTAMMLKNPSLIPGAQTLIGLGARLIPKKLGGIFAQTKELLKKLSERPTDVERVVMRDNFLTDVTRVDDFASSPELVNFQKALSGGVKKIETAQDIELSRKTGGFWLKAVGNAYSDMATNLGKGIAEKFGMTLEKAGRYKEAIINGRTVKIYENPEVAQSIKDASEALLTYKEGFQTSPLIKTMNLIWFPIRFQVKSMELTAKWIGSLSPMNRMLVMSNWSNFANWVGNDEGKKWRDSHQNLLYNILAYATAYEQIGKSIDAVSRGELFGGQTGLIGGVPFGFVYNIAQELALMGQDPQTLDPKTGLPFSFKLTPRKLVSYTAFVTALEELLITLAPGMPLYTLSGGVFKGVSWGSLAKRMLDQGLGAAGIATGLLPGEDITKGALELQRQKERVPLDYRR